MEKINKNLKLDFMDDSKYLKEILDGAGIDMFDTGRIAKQLAEVLGTVSYITSILFLSNQKCDIKIYCIKVDGVKVTYLLRKKSNCVYLKAISAFYKSLRHFYSDPFTC